MSVPVDDTLAGIYAEMAYRDHRCARCDAAESRATREAQLADALASAVERLKSQVPVYVWALHGADVDSALVAIKDARR